MKPAIKHKLLAAEDARAFLRTLRESHGLSTAQVAGMLERHGGTSARQTISRYELGDLKVSSGVQLAYALAFGLDDELRLLLQRLAGESYGIAA